MSTVSSKSWNKTTQQATKGKNVEMFGIASSKMNPRNSRCSSQPVYSVNESVSVDEDSNQRNIQVLKSRGRSIKMYETEPFLSVDLLPSNKICVSPVPSLSSEKPRARSMLRSHTTQSPLTVANITNNLTHSRRSTPSAGNKVGIERSTANPHIKKPFKHAVNQPTSATSTDQMSSPSKLMKANLKIATSHINSILLKQRHQEPIKVKGKLLKGKLKPMYPVNTGGPSMKDCRGVISDATTYSSSPSRTLQRRRQILSNYNQGNITMLIDRPVTVESVHQTSEASSMDGNVDRMISDLDSDDQEEEEDLYERGLLVYSELTTFPSEKSSTTSVISQPLHQAEDENEFEQLPKAAKQVLSDEDNITINKTAHVSFSPSLERRLSENLRMSEELETFVGDKNSSNIGNNIGKILATTNSSDAMLWSSADIDAIDVVRKVNKTDFNATKVDKKYSHVISQNIQIDSTQSSVNVKSQDLKKDKIAQNQFHKLDKSRSGEIRSNHEPLPYAKSSSCKHTASKPTKPVRVTPVISGRPFSAVIRQENFQEAVPSRPKSASMLKMGKVSPAKTVRFADELIDNFVIQSDVWQEEESSSFRNHLTLNICHVEPEKKDLEPPSPHSSIFGISKHSDQDDIYPDIENEDDKVVSKSSCKPTTERKYQNDDDDDGGGGCSDEDKENKAIRQAAEQPSKSSSTKNAEKRRLTSSNGQGQTDDNDIESPVATIEDNPSGKEDDPLGKENASVISDIKSETSDLNMSFISDSGSFHYHGDISAFIIDEADLPRTPSSNSSGMFSDFTSSYSKNSHGKQDEIEPFIKDTNNSSSKTDIENRKNVCSSSCLNLPMSESKKNSVTVSLASPNKVELQNKLRSLSANTQTIKKHSRNNGYQSPNKAIVNRMQIDSLEAAPFFDPISDVSNLNAHLYENKSLFYLPIEEAEFIEDICDITCPDSPVYMVDPHFNKNIPPVEATSCHRIYDKYQHNIKRGRRPYSASTVRKSTTRPLPKRPTSASPDFRKKLFGEYCAMCKHQKSYCRCKTKSETDLLKNGEWTNTTKEEAKKLETEMKVKSKNEIRSNRIPDGILKLNFEEEDEYETVDIDAPNSPFVGGSTFDALDLQLRAIQHDIRQQIEIDEKKKKKVAFVKEIDEEDLEDDTNESESSSNLETEDEGDKQIMPDYQSLLDFYRKKCCDSGNPGLVLSKRIVTCKNRVLLTDVVASPIECLNRIYSSRSDVHKKLKYALEAVCDPGLKLELNNLASGCFLQYVCDFLPEVGKEERMKTKQNDDALSETTSINGGLKVIATRKTIFPPTGSLIEDEDEAPFPPLCFSINARPPPGYVYYFTYGTDMNKDRLGMYIRRNVEKKRWGILFGFNLLFNKKGADEEGFGFPNIEFNPFGCVEGCVYQLSNNELHLLDSCVGYPEHYEHIVVPVWMTSDKPDDCLAQYCVPALTFIAQDKWIENEKILPCDFSLSQCIKGSDMLSTGYVQHLRTIASFTSF
ncbi:uncharacterized protein LOC126831043 [Patella vulgata]|uniref:uncharacterized protein LOC126831043 n=1 Tax=Patella vulgata TaxID=6465 RepID=UPI00217FAFA8|nr:uncharacterized protein LOC126831043 [Patella vulgata]